MKQLILLISAFISLNTLAQESVSLELLESKYILDENLNYPSCLIAKHRSKQREKVLREYAHHAKKSPKYRDFFFVNDYLMNKYFLDFSLWNDEVVSVRNIWKIEDASLKKLKEGKDKTYFWLMGDGVNWVERVSFFPKDATFEFDFENKTLTTVHKTYYHDYCFPEKETELYWFPDSGDGYESTVNMINDFLSSEEGV